MKDGNAKTISKCLVNMLGSIPAPPAFAAEYPAGAAKSMAQTSAVHPTSSTHVTAGFVHICDPTVSGSVGHWSLQKNGHAGFILSYRMADNVSRKTSDFVPSSKNQVDAVSMVLRGGLYVLFLLPLFLTISYKVGITICGR